tara:strand:- start:50 stop:472 length:423 start_codon:yes stop_codon:yes gene_type:complete
MQFQIGDIVISNNPWLVGLLGVRNCPGVIVQSGLYSSKVRLFSDGEEITLMNDYIDKISMNHENKQELKVGDLVELKPKIRAILSVQGIGTIIAETNIKTSDLDSSQTGSIIESFLVYFPEEDYTYTLPRGCLQLFSGQK